ncbi:hypothetical protein PanWU01x14_168170 [Parasponia andersonii]|uniref:Uncharacterized protein n=1 Tax=Parasponia andersonii TaxID=3476 RepID=A0A2P5CAZ8_PARAD|nr:hypothetical protein PanWU01x14_168170 [Parasponia andersonii]
MSSLCFQPRRKRRRLARLDSRPCLAQKPLAFEASQPDPGAFPLSVRIAGLRSSNAKGGGPRALVSQVFSMGDLSAGTGPTAISTHF